MIIIIGKEDKAFMLDACAYINQKGDDFRKDTSISKESRDSISDDCFKIAGRIHELVRGNFRQKIKRIFK